MLSDPEGGTGMVIVDSIVYVIACLAFMSGALTLNMLVVLEV